MPKNTIWKAIKKSLRERKQVLRREDRESETQIYTYRFWYIQQVKNVWLLFFSPTKMNKKLIKTLGKYTQIGLALGK